MRDDLQNVEENASICVIDKTEPSDPHMKDYYWMRTRNSVQDEPFLGCSWIGVGAKRPLPKICPKYLTKMKLGTVILHLKKIQKIFINHVIHPLNSADISIFSPEISNFCYIKKYRHRLHFNTYFLILLTLFQYLKVVLINMVATLIC